MKILIDASNIRGGGGLTHLAKILEFADDEGKFFSKVSVWCGSATAEKLDFGKKNISVYTHPWLDRGIFWRIFWRLLILKKISKTKKYDVLFFPGGSVLKTEVKTVTMFQNMLPFDVAEKARYGWGTKERYRLEILRRYMGESFCQSDGLIVLTDHAKGVLNESLGQLSARQCVIPHGISDHFYKDKYVQDERKKNSDLKILCVSTINLYKHQWKVAEAVCSLRGKYRNISVDFIGGGDELSLTKFSDSLKYFDPNGEYLFYHGKVDHDLLHMKYDQASIFVFPSTCENLPIILLEAMASGVPIVSSNKEPMPTVLSDSGLYYDPENSDDLAVKLDYMIQNPEEVAEMSTSAILKSKSYNWIDCSDKTFRFLKEVYDA